MVIRKNIQLPTVEAVKEFVNAMCAFDFPVDLRSGRYCVNGRSIMGIFSLDLNQPIQLEATMVGDQEEAFLKAVEPFCV